MKAAQYSSASCSVSTLHSRSVPRRWIPPLPPMCSSYPESTQITPKSLIVASAQLRGQPDTAILNLCGIHEPQVICSVLIPSPVESCVPKRHHSDPTRSEENTSELQSHIRS